MALVVKDRVKQFSTTAGTGTLSLGSTPSGFQSFSAIGDGNTTYYAITNTNTGDWEVGIGTYTLSGDTLSRDTVLASSNSGNLVNFNADSKEVFVTYAADKAVYEQANGNVELPANLAFTGTGNRITGDFSSTAPVANRVMFQTSTLNGNTLVTAIPNGTATQTNLVLVNNSDTANASTAVLLANATESRLAAGRIGTGTFNPLTFHTGGSERVRIDTSGNVGIGTSSIAGRLSLGSLVANRVLAVYDDGTDWYGLGISGSNFQVNAPTTAAITFNGYNRSTDALTERMRIASDGAQSSVIPGGSTLYPEFKCRAWVNFEGRVSPVAIRGSGNVSSVTRNGTGDYTLNFSTAMPDTNYAVGGMAGTDNSNEYRAPVLKLIQTGALRITVQSAGGSLSNTDNVTIQIFR